MINHLKKRIPACESSLGSRNADVKLEAGPWRAIDTTPDTLIQFEQVTKTFKGRTVFANFDLTIKMGEALGILGPNGAGKSTILRLIAGLESPCAGTVSVKTERIGYVFQEPRLLPWDSVLRNVALPVLALGTDPEFARNRARHFLSLMELSSFEAAYPHQLSGGMRQRVSLARAFAINPDLLLLDEPFTGLDKARRTATKALLESILKSSNATVIHVTHDPGELINGMVRTLTIGPHIKNLPWRHRLKTG